MNNNIDNNLLKNALIDSESVASAIEESAKGTSKAIIKESLLEVMSKLIIESEEDTEDKNGEDEVKDTFSTDVEPDESGEDSDEFDGEGDDTEDNSEYDDFEDSEADSDEDAQDESNDEEWGEFDKYKVGDREYDFRSANEADLTSVYSILKNDDNIEVRENGDNVYEVNNGETEFIIIPTDSDTSVEVSREETSGDFEPTDMEGLFDSITKSLMGGGTPFGIGACDGGDCCDGDGCVEIELDGEDEARPNDTAEDDVEDIEDDDNKVKESKIMSRNTIYEVALNEDNLGYGMKQTKGAFTTPTDSSWDNGDTEEWDDGVPHGENKPNLKKGATPFKEGRNRRGVKLSESIYGDFANTDVWDELPSDGGSTAGQKEVTPFEDGIGGPLKEEDEMDFDMMDEEDDLMMDEATNVGGAVQQHTTSKSHIPNNRKDSGYIPYGSRNISTAEDTEATPTTKGIATEAVIRKTNKILKENKALKQALKKFEGSLNEAAVLNVNLKNALRLVTENTTSASEKKAIVEQFSGVKSVNESKMLYNNIKRTLSGAKAKNINEAKAQQPIAVKPAPATEKVIYKSNDLNESLDLMARMNKVVL